MKLSNLVLLSIPDEGYSRNASCTLNLLFTFYISLFIMFGKYREQYVVFPVCNQMRKWS